MKFLLKKIYEFIPFKKYIFLIVKKIYSPPEFIYKHLYFKSIFKVIINKNTNFKIKHYGFFLENEIFWKGIFNSYEKNSLIIWAKLSETSNSIFDIGANTGIYSLLSKSINPNSKVYAFEPINRIFDKLEINNKLNKYNISCINTAVSNFEGSVFIQDDPNKEHIYSAKITNTIDKNKSHFTQIKTKSITLDYFIKKKNILNIDLIKIDVENHEIQVLEGFNEFIKEFQPTILIEVLNDEIAQGIQKIISSIDYIYYNIDDRFGIKKVDNLSKHNSRNFLICKKNISKIIEPLF